MKVKTIIAALFASFVGLSTVYVQAETSDPAATTGTSGTGTTLDQGDVDNKLNQSKDGSKKKDRKARQSSANKSQSGTGSAVGGAGAATDADDSSSATGRSSDRSVNGTASGVDGTSGGGF